MWIVCKLFRGKKIVKLKESMYIDGRPKESGNIAGFINNTQLRATNKQPNCIFKGCEGNCGFVCNIKSIVVGEQLLLSYNLYQINTCANTSEVLHITSHQTYIQ